MSSLVPTYRVLINQNMLKYPLFFDYLKQELHRHITNLILQGNIDLTIEYTFTVYSIPLQWGNYIIPMVKQQELLPEDKVSPKWKRISEILLQLDPVNPQPVNLSFTLQEIVSFTLNNVHHFQEATSGGLQDYFGIETERWFDDYPLQTGTVLKSVDIGTLDNKPLHLFDTAFMYIRGSLMDLFTVYLTQLKQQENEVVVKNVDV